jgi:wyosine [tRNA(Phe)-imidazoG37] synthetase (radical SAM superfamily)|tara:strand:- start:3138 stop:3797 length:660 start_codon:yes stop_codon:yes gene_type:complete
MPTRYPIGFDFAITSYCQARCKTCPRTNSETGEKADWLVLEHHDYNNFEQTTTNSRYYNTNDVKYIKFCGQTGDPMMHPDITKFIDQAFKLTNKVIINTNGGLRNADWYKTMGNKYGNKLKIVFGIDGIDHDTNWKYREGVNFAKAWENMVAYCDTPGESQWDFLIFEWNYDQIPEVAKLAKEINVDEVDYKLNTGEHGRLNPEKKPLVEEMICQANTI